MTATVNRDELIEKIVDASTSLLPAIVQRSVFRDPIDGRTYSPMGLPRGMSTEGMTKETYFVFQAKNGTTYGNRYKSQREAIESFMAGEKLRKAEMREELAKMSDEHLECQASYWMGDER